MSETSLKPVIDKLENLFSKFNEKLHRFPGKTGSRGYVINLKVNFQN